MGGKRAAPEDELEIDVSAPAPPSKKQLRRLKKHGDTANAPAAESPEPVKKGVNGIWIGNLPYSTTEESLKEFFHAGSTALRKGDSRILQLEDVTRVSLPLDARTRRCKGFAYVDFADPECLAAALRLNERILDGRNVLIKPAESFEGRPKPADAPAAGLGDDKDPSILYVGNLGFETTADSLAEFLGGETGGVKRVRLATFEDTGKCKGFAFVDMKDKVTAPDIITSRKYAVLDGRRLKLELGQDRSKRRRPPQRDRVPDVPRAEAAADNELTDYAKGTIQKSLGTKVSFS